MLSRKWHVLLVLLGIGVLLAAGNLWYSLVRSTVPLAIEGRVVRKELRHEKHPGRDDVCFLHIESGLVLHVDCEVFDAVQEGEHVRKQGWSTSLEHDGQILALSLSHDFRGMLIVMPLMLATCVITGISAIRKQMPQSHVST